MKILRYSLLMMVLVLLVLTGCSERNQEVSNPVNGMKHYTNEKANVSTVIGEEWEEIDNPQSDDAIDFQADANGYVSIYQSLILVTSSNPEDELEYLQSHYEKHDSDDEFIREFTSYYSELTGLAYEEFDSVGEDIPIFHNTEGEMKSFFSVIVSENTPYFIHLSANSDSSEIKNKDYYTFFKEVVKHTQPLN